MKRTPNIIATALLVGILLVPAAWAADAEVPVDVASVSPGRANTPVTADNLPAYLDEDLASKHADFSRFAKAWIRKSNQHHVHSRSRMQIKREANGSYSALFHRSDENDVVCTVKKNSKGVYTAILRYKEIIYKTVAESPDACHTAEFLPSLVNRRIRIFKLHGGTWE